MMRRFCSCECEALTIRLVNVMINIIISIVTLLVTLFCIYVVYDSLKVTHSAVLGEEILAYAPHDENVEIEPLWEINSDIIGWIRINGTSIDYPVVQGRDNEFYLSRNYRQEFATAGSIFMDYRNSLSDDFIVIYGHRMSYGGMFTDIIRFKERRFFDENSSGELFIMNEKWKLEIVGFALVESNNREIYDLGDSAVREIMTHATFVREINADRFVLLSTCDAQNKNMRNVLLAQIIE